MAGYSGSATGLLPRGGASAYGVDGDGGYGEAEARGERGRRATAREAHRELVGEVCGAGDGVAAAYLGGGAAAVTETNSSGVVDVQPLGSIPPRRRKRGSRRR